MYTRPIKAKLNVLECKLAQAKCRTAHISHCLRLIVHTFGKRCRKGSRAGYEEDPEPWQPDLHIVR